MPPRSSNNSGTQTDKRPGTIQSVSIAMRFLNILANAGEPLALRDISREAEAGASTTHRYLQSLVKEELASQDPATGLYDLGPASLSIGIAALRRIDPIEVAAQQMKKMASNMAANSGIAIWTERGPTLVRWYKSTYFSINSVGLGDILPLDNTACGLLFQAYLPKEKIAVARALQPEKFRGKAPTENTVENIRRRGQVSLQNHLLPNFTGQAVPVFDAQGDICCVMTTVNNVGQHDEQSDTLFKAAEEVAHKTGGWEAFQRYLKKTPSD